MYGNDRMKQAIFETHQRAAELLKEATQIWRQSDQSDYLEGLENDPVISLMMMAIAYQGNEIDSEIERLKEETLDELARSLAPYEIGHATPASMVIQTALQADVSELEADEKTLFSWASNYPFMPLFKTRLLNTTVASVVRVDGRRWKVTLEFAHPVKDLGGFTFAIDDLDFRDLTVTIGKHPLPLIKPWDYSEWPYTDCFAPQSVLFNSQQVCNLSMLPMDLFARHQTRLFCVDRYYASQMTDLDAERLELIFEFTGITDKFLFDKSHIMLNAMVLVNAQLHEATLTSQKPFERIAGYNEASGSDSMNNQFLHLLQPSDAQIFGNSELEVRRVDADRFNQSSLMKLLQCILNRYHTDFYAFQNLKGLTTDKLLYNLQEAIKALMEAGSDDAQHNVPGAYLLLKNKTLMRNKDFSMSVKYLTTAGAAINQELNGTDRLSTPSGLDDNATRVLKQPIPGSDEISNDADIHSMLRYYMLTNDRLVTPADIKLFCHKELQIRYGLSDNMIRQLRVSRRQTNDRRDCGYELLVDITLTSHSFVTRTFADNLSSAEMLMQKMIEVRTTGIYPVSVSIRIEETKNEQ